MLNQYYIDGMNPFGPDVVSFYIVLIYICWSFVYTIYIYVHERYQSVDFFF